VVQTKRLAANRCCRMTSASHNQHTPSPCPAYEPLVLSAMSTGTPNPAGSDAADAVVT